MLADNPFGTGALQTNQADAVIQFEQNFLFKWLLTTLFQLLIQSFSHLEQFRGQLLVVFSCRALKDHLDKVAKAVSVTVKR